MSIKSEYEQAKKDYKYLVVHHDAEPNDISGGFLEGEYYMELLDNPCKKLATLHFISLISHTVNAGFEEVNGFKNITCKSPDFKDEGTIEIYRRYCLEDEVMSMYGVDINF